MDYRKVLDKRICDCEEEATNTQTYLEFILEGYSLLGSPLDKDDIIWIKEDADSEDIYDMIEELDWLLDK